MVKFFLKTTTYLVAHCQNKRMHPVLEILGKNTVDSPLAGNAGHSGKGIGGDIDPEVTFPLRMRTRVTDMQMRFVDDFQLAGRKGFGQLALDGLGNGHSGKSLLRLLDQ